MLHYYHIGWCMIYLSYIIDMIFVAFFPNGKCVDALWIYTKMVYKLIEVEWRIYALVK